MFGVYFGKYLLGKGILTNEQYKKILSDMKNVKVKLGLLAVEIGMMTNQQADEVNRLQQLQDKRFGDIAVEKGYLTEDQVSTLLSKQGDEYLAFIQILVDQGFLNLDQIQKEINLYKKAGHYSALDVEAIKSGDIDKIVQVFMKDNLIPPIIKDYFALIARNIVRFIDTHFRMEDVERVNDYTTHYLASQELDGDYRVLTSFAGSAEGIKFIADTFGQENFETVDMDALDAVCEFLNCNNGLYASKLSNEDIDLDMKPPMMKDQVTTIYSDGNMFKVPLFINDFPVDLIICIESKWSIQ